MLKDLRQRDKGALQASGRAGERQVKDVNVSFVGASAPVMQGTTFIFVREPCDALDHDAPALALPATSRAHS